MRIIAVDDEPVSRKLVTTILEKDGHDVVDVASAKEAIEKLNQGLEVDMIISDVMMPEMDGFDLLRSVRCNARLKDIPFVLCTCLGDKQAVGKAIRLGATGYVVKPIEAATLLKKVGEIAAKRTKTSPE